jgi:hypothetical protein
MEKVSIDKSKLLAIYEAGDENKKREMEGLYGKEVFLKSVMERIQSYEDACADQGKNPEEELPWKNPTNPDQVCDNTNVMLRIIAKSLKGSFKANYGDSNEKKWSPWFKWNGSGFGFAGSYCAYTLTFAGVGSRFAFPDEKTSNHFGKQFLALHNIVLTEL